MTERTYESVLQDLKDHPEKHKHNWGDLAQCCMIGGALDITLMDLHSQLVDLGTNGGVRCDTIKGPCACGAFH